MSKLVISASFEYTCSGSTVNIIIVLFQCGDRFRRYKDAPCAERVHFNNKWITQQYEMLTEWDIHWAWYYKRKYKTIWQKDRKSHFAILEILTGVNRSWIFTKLHLQWYITQLCSVASSQNITQRNKKSEIASFWENGLWSSKMQLVNFLKEKHKKIKLKERKKIYTSFFFK